MKKFFKVLLWLVLVIGIVIGIVIGFVQLTWDKPFDAPYPDIAASSDPAVIERGRYLAYGPSHCASCHTPIDKVIDVDNGLQIPLSGGWQEEFPGFGTFRASNLTPDLETGIGKISDRELARAIRFGVKHDGSMLAPFMEYQGMSDEDLTAVISFLRSQEPVNHKVEQSELAFPVKALITFGIMKPMGPKITPPVSVLPDSSAAYGKYLANNIGNCRGCHIAMDDKGNQLNADFAGGGIFPPNSFSNGYAFVSPNLTPDKATGVMADWSEQQFIDRFQGGRLHDGSPMPWGLYSRMSVNDIKAIYQYLHSLDPVEYKVEKTLYAPGEEMPQ